MCIIFSIYWGLFLGQAVCVSLINTDMRKYVMMPWNLKGNTGYPDTQKYGLSAQAHSCSSTHSLWNRCAPLELCYFAGCQGSHKSLRLTCLFHTHTHTHTHIQRAGVTASFYSPFSLNVVSPWREMSGWQEDYRNKGWVGTCPFRVPFLLFVLSPLQECQD